MINKFIEIVFYIGHLASLATWWLERPIHLLSKFIAVQDSSFLVISRTKEWISNSGTKNEDI